ncbi:MAG: hypothetical protein ACXABY_06555 [Candidatus Thorarchaeota archaeon]|jgi:hypothetical protein
MFNDEPRPKTVCQLGFLVVELGERQRKCRGCGVKIFKGTYHISVGTMDSMASLKFCQQCIESAAGWCKTSNRRNL